MDSKGNTRPIFTILKEMQASFEKISWVLVSEPNI
jgi:hypothetical protein